MDKRFAELRNKAEAMLQKRGIDRDEFNNDIEKLLEELNIYQIELEMQNQELQEANRMLEISEKKYKELYNNAPIAYFSLNRTGNILQMNEAASIMIGLSKGQYQFTPIFHFLEEKSKVVFTRYFNRVFHSEETVFGEITFKHTSGRLIHGHVQANSFFDIQMNELLYRITVTDITEKKKKEENIKLKAELLNAIGQAVFATDPKGIITYVNHAAEDLYGWTDNEIIGRNIMNVTVPDTIKDKGGKIMNKLRKGKNWQGEFQVQRKDGTNFLAEVHLSGLINEKGNLIAVIAVSSDITPRKRAEQELIESERKQRSIIDHSAQGFAMYNNQLKIEYANAALSEMTGYSKEGLIGKNVLDLIPLDKKTHIKNELLSGHYQSHLVYNLDMICKDTTTIPVLLSHTRVIGDDARTVASFAFFTDLTEQKKSEYALQESARELHELNASKDKLISIISHDLKNPLNNIIGFSDLIEKYFDKYPDEKIRKYNRLVNESATSISTLLDNLLIWSRSQRKTVSVNFSLFNIHEEVNASINLLAATSMQKQIRIINEVPGGLTGFADKEMIATVIRNLISNAIKFTHRRGTIRVHAQQQNHNLVIGISDTGVGMEKEIADNLFNFNNTLTTKGTDGESGSGLGLIICKELVEKNQGEIWVESQVEKGTTFYFSIPANKL